jgi:hypothetical protein
VNSSQQFKKPERRKREKVSVEKEGKKERQFSGAATFGRMTSCRKTLGGASHKL